MVGNAGLVVDTTDPSGSKAIDTVFPTVTSLLEPSGDPVDTDGAVTYRLTLSEPVQPGTVTTADFEASVFDGTNSTTATVNSVTAVATSASGGGYTQFDIVATGTGDAGSTLNLTLKTDAKFTDVAGNETTITSGTAVTEGSDIDTIAPTVDSFSTTASGALKDGGTVQIKATTSEDIASGSKITVTLNTDTNAKVVLTASSDGDELVGTYTVGPDDDAASL